MRSQTEKSIRFVGMIRLDERDAEKMMLFSNGTHTITHTHTFFVSSSNDFINPININNQKDFWRFSVKLEK